MLNFECQSCLVHFTIFKSIPHNAKDFTSKSVQKTISSFYLGLYKEIVLL